MLVLKGYEVTLKDTTSKGYFMVVAVIAESEEKAIDYAKNEIGKDYEVTRIEVYEKGVIMTDSYIE